MPSVVQELLQLESRLDNAIMFTLVQTVHRIVRAYVSNVEIIAGGLVASGLHELLKRQGGGEASSWLLERVVLLLAGQAVADLVGSNALHAKSRDVFVVVQTVTVLCSVLILASSLSERVGSMSVMVQRGLTVTMYIFADAIGNLLHHYDLGMSPFLLGLMFASCLQTWEQLLHRWGSLRFVVQGVNVVVVNVVMESTTADRGAMTQLFMLFLLVLAVDCVSRTSSVMQQVRDYAVWAAARRIGALVSASTLSAASGELSPAVLIVILASERLLHLKDSVISQLVILTASNDVLSSATKFASSIRGLDQIALLLLYVLVLDTIRNLAPRRGTSLA